MRVACIIQAREGSKRLPGKVRMDIGGRQMIWHVQKRATYLAEQPGWKYEDYGVRVAWPHDYDGDESDVLGRYHHVAKQMGAGAVIRITGDCPLMAPEAIQSVLCSFQTLLYDYVANDIHPTYPDGLGVECFSFSALEYAHQNATKPADREHVTPFLLRDKTISKLNIRCPINGISDLKLSVDTQEDLDFVRAIDAAQPRDFSLAATLEAIERVKDQNIA